MGGGTCSQSSVLRLHLRVRLSGLLLFVRTGTQIGAQTLAVVGAGTVSAANVEAQVAPERFLVHSSIVYIYYMPIECPPSQTK